jgi:uncharacterized protein (TIGR03437 family)
MSWRRYTPRLLLGCVLAWFAILAISNLLADLSTAADPSDAADLATASTAPSYSGASIVNAATQTIGTLAPNTIATIYGTNLSWTTHAVTSADLDGGTLPSSLEGVTVYVNGIVGSLFYVSPGQINFLIPYEIVATTATVYVARQGVSGPPAVIPLANAAPGFFQWSGNFALAEHADGSLISSSSPAQAGEIVVLYAAGLGRTSPDVSAGHIVFTATSILYASELQILLNGVPCPSSSIYYAGLAPGYAGLYQINLMLPDVLPPDPSIRMVMGAQTSPGAIFLYAN